MKSSSVDWAGLPEPVRARLAELGAAALGDLPAGEIPQRLRPVAKFAPAKRARVAAGPVVAALGERTAFRAAVVQWTRTHRPRVLAPEQDDDVARAVTALLLDTDDAVEAVGVVAERATEAGLRAERDALRTRVERLESEVGRLQSKLNTAQAEVEAVRAERTPELERLRGRLRERGMELRRARDEAEQAREALAGADSDTDSTVAELRERLERAQGRAAAEKARADKAEAEASATRRSIEEARRGDDARVSLLLDALAGAVDGLRGELRLQAGTPGGRPGDTITGAGRPSSATSPVADVPTLERVLAVPETHVIVDGYNVTKTGYPDLPLSEQRERLVWQLTAVVARTSVEVTVVFDGAAVVAVPAVRTRDVRVLFSEPGVTADEVIKHLVAAEPGGRPLLVVTADREIVDAVRANGARTVGPGILLDRLTRV